MAKRVDVDWAFRALVVSGLSIREVARRLGVGLGTALRKAQIQNWGIAKLHGRKNSTPKPVTSKEMLARTERTLQAGKDFFREANGQTKFHLAKANSSVLLGTPGRESIAKHLRALDTHVLGKAYEPLASTYGCKDISPAKG